MPYQQFTDPPWTVPNPGQPQNNPTEWARDPAWLVEVAQTPERDLRGHRIALTYHTLAIDLYKWIYNVDALDQDRINNQKPKVNANWFNFATWATATLNADIRNDDAPYRTDWLVPIGLRRLTPTILAIKSSNRQRYNQLLTWYQRMVFINTTFAYWAIREWDDNQRLPGQNWFANPTNGDIDGGFKDVTFPNLDGNRKRQAQGWIAAAQALAMPYGAAKSALNDERHLRPVAMAFEYFRRARLVTLELGNDPTPGDRTERLRTLRARLIYFGDLIITSVEQDLVDPGVNRVLNEVPSVAGDYATARIAHAAARHRGVPRQLAELRIAVKLQPAQNYFEQTWVRVLTRELLVLALPAETLRLGHDVPPIAAGEPYYPPELRQFDPLLNPTIDPGLVQEGTSYDAPQQDDDNARLQQIVNAFDRSSGFGQGTGARDWRRVVERINWATTMIRTRIQDPSLFWPPYRNEDVERIYCAKLPLHRGNPTDFDVLGPLESFPYLSGGGHVPAALTGDDR